MIEKRKPREATLGQAEISSRPAGHWIGLCARTKDGWDELQNTQLAGSGRDYLPGGALPFAWLSPSCPSCQLTGRLPAARGPSRGPGPASSTQGAAAGCSSAAAACYERARRCAAGSRALCSKHAARSLAWPLGSLALGIGSAGSMAAATGGGEFNDRRVIGRGCWSQELNSWLVGSSVRWIGWLVGWMVGWLLGCLVALDVAGQVVGGSRQGAVVGGHRPGTAVRGPPEIAAGDRRGEGGRWQVIEESPGSRRGVIRELSGRRQGLGWES